jgi:hypothetical protein
MHSLKNTDQNPPVCCKTINQETFSPKSINRISGGSQGALPFGNILPAEALFDVDYPRILSPVEPEGGAEKSRKPRPLSVLTGRSPNRSRSTAWKMASHPARVFIGGAAGSGLSLAQGTSSTAKTRLLSPQKRVSGEAEARIRPWYFAVPALKTHSASLGSLLKTGPPPFPRFTTELDESFGSIAPMIVILWI